MDETQQPSSGRTASRQAEPPTRPEDARLWLAALVNSSDDVIISTTLDGVITSWNTAAQQIYGYSAEEVIGTSISLLFPADQLDECDEILRRLRQAERIDHLETARVRRDGRRIEVSVTISPIIDAQGQIIGALTIARDITARKADERLAYQALVLENMHDAVVAADERLVVTAWNRAAEQLYGWTAAEVLGRDIRDVVRSDFDPEERAEGYRVLAETGHYRAQAVHHRKDGSPIHIEGSIVALRDAAERMTGYVYVYRDITERKRAEAALRKAQVRTESILESVADTHIVFDQQWRYLYVNTAAAHAMGRPREQILGHTLWELYPDIVGTELERQYRSAMDERLSVAFDFHYASNDTWWNNRFSPTLEGLAVFATDITERKRAEEALGRAHDDLEAKVAERTRELAEVNAALRVENAERLRTAALLRETNENVEMILESITDRFFALDDEWRYTYFNKHAEEQLRALGKDPASLIGKVLWEEFPNPPSEEELRRSMRERVVTIDEQYFPPLGEWYENRIYPSRDGGVAVFQRYVTERKRAEAIRQQLLQQLITAQEDERGRISRELHDSMGQFLTALHLGLKVVQIRDDATAGVADAIQQLRELALRIDEQLDRLTLALRPAVLDDLGLAEALRELVKEWSATSHIPVDLHASHLDHERPPATLETTIYRIVQEALTNVLKHAQATRVSLVVESRGAEVQTIIEDDGRGFDIDALRHEPDVGRQLGLRGMEERAALAGGRLDIETAVGAGTTIYVHIPLAS